MKPLKIDDIIDREIQNLSGGELQRVALALCLYKPTEVSFNVKKKKNGFVVEHDFIMATYLADRVIVLSGVLSMNTTAQFRKSLLNRVSNFLDLLGITFGRNANNFIFCIKKNQPVNYFDRKRAGSFLPGRVRIL